MKKNIKLILILLSSIILAACNQKDENILYSWSMDAVEDKELEDYISKYNIKELYQDFSTKYLEEEDSSFIHLMHNMDVLVYHLAGDPSWGKDLKADKMKKEIDKVLAFNNRNEEKIDGIVFDIESYTDSSDVKSGKDDFDFDTYTKSIINAYNYAKNYNLYMVIAIPVWFEKVSIENLEELISSGCDEISLMNYNIKYTRKNIEEEIDLAKKYNKSVNTIYEINFSNDKYFQSYDEINSDFKDIYNYYNYNKLKKAYHYYGKMKEFERE